MAGIKKILIPIKQSDLSIDKLYPYLNYVLQTFKANKEKIDSDYDKYCLQHTVLLKQRIHDDTDVNNKVLQPHLMAMVDWKTGYVFGNPIKYAQSKDNQTDDIAHLNKYARNSNKRSVDKEVGMWAYATGVGYYFIEPKRDDFNIDYEAPFELFCRPSNSCVKVYSSYNGNKPLFDMLYTSISKPNELNEQPKLYDIINIYLPDKMYEFEILSGQQLSQNNLVREENRPIYNKLPLVEKRINPNGIGIVAMAESLQNALDNIASHELDNIAEVVNILYKYKGVNIGDTSEKMIGFHKSVRKNGAVVIPFTQGMPFEPDVELEKTDALDFSDVDILAENLKRTMYETVGVPLATNSTNSGGTTKSGSEVANGYDNAYNRALDDINSFLLADNDLLEKMLFICQNTPNNKINDLHASEIEIKYSLNLNDNMQIKTQSLGTCIGVGMPPAMALRITRLSNDPEAEGKLWEDYMAQKNQQAQENQMQISEEQTRNSDSIEENLDNK